MYETDDYEKLPQQIQNDELPEAPFVDKSLESRLNFIKNVYIIFTLHQLIVGVVTLFSIGSPFLCDFETKQIYLLVIVALLTIIMIYYLLFEKILTRKAPQNYILLGVLTLFESYVISAFSCYIVNQYEIAIHFIFYAIYINMIMIAGLTIFTSLKIKFFDFTKLWVLIIPFLIYIFLQFLCFLISSDHQNLIQYPLLLILIYNLYIVYDMYLMVGQEKRYQLRKDDFVLGTLILNIDIIVLPLQQVKNLLVWKNEKN